jgi:hypothetical protein
MPDMENSLINRLVSDTGFIRQLGVLVRNDYKDVWLNQLQLEDRGEWLLNMKNQLA